MLATAALPKPPRSVDERCSACTFGAPRIGTSRAVPAGPPRQLPALPSSAAVGEDALTRWVRMLFTRRVADTDYAWSRAREADQV